MLFTIYTHTYQLFQNCSFQIYVLCWPARFLGTISIKNDDVHVLIEEITYNADGEYNITLAPACAVVYLMFLCRYSPRPTKAESEHADV